MVLKKGNVFVLLLLVAVLFGACKKDEEDKQQVEHNQIIQYAADNNLDGYFTESGLYYVVIEEGTGDHPTLESNIAVAYTLYDYNGTVLQENDYFTSKLNKLILGWQEGIPLMKEDGKCKLIVPSHLAYDDGIRIFDITLFSFSK